MDTTQPQHGGEVKHRISGPKARYRGKVRSRVMSIMFTPTGHEALAAGMARTRLSRQDYLEWLVRRDNGRRA